MKSITELHIGDTYNDPEGEWEILDIGERVTINLIQEDNLNYGQIAIVEKEEVLYFINNWEDL